MTETELHWPGPEEIERDRIERWKALSTEKKLDFLETFVHGLTVLRMSPAEPVEVRNGKKAR